jgi:hypothetical protein
MNQRIEHLEHLVKRIVAGHQQSVSVVATPVSTPSSEAHAAVDTSTLDLHDSDACQTGEPGGDEWYAVLQEVNFPYFFLVFLYEHFDFRSLSILWVEAG